MNHIEQNELFTNLLRFLDSLTLAVMQKKTIVQLKNGMN